MRRLTSLLAAPAAAAGITCGALLASSGDTRPTPEFDPAILVTGKANPNRESFRVLVALCTDLTPVSAAGHTGYRGVATEFGGSVEDLNQYTAFVAMSDPTPGLSRGENFLAIDPTSCEFTKKEMSYPDIVAQANGATGHLADLGSTNTDALSGVYVNLDGVRGPTHDSPNDFDVVLAIVE